MKTTTKKNNLILTERDVVVLMQLYLHRAALAGQLAKLCFSNISYETARKRLRKLQQAGYIGFDNASNIENKGRPEFIYFLTSLGAKMLEQYRGIPVDIIPTGVPHTYHKEHFLRLVDVRLSLEKAKKKKLIKDLQWNIEKEYWKEFSDNSVRKTFELADASITFQYPASTEKINIIVQIDTGNLRQTRHWEPKMRSFLKTGHFIWVITNNVARISTLKKWTNSLWQELGFNSDKCLFATYNEIMAKGIFGASWYRADGVLAKLRPAR